MAQGILDRTIEAGGNAALFSANAAMLGLRPAAKGFVNAIDTEYEDEAYQERHSTTATRRGGVMSDAKLLELRSGSRHAYMGFSGGAQDKVEAEQREGQRIRQFQQQVARSFTQPIANVLAAPAKFINNCFNQAKDFVGNTINNVKEAAGNLYQGAKEKIGETIEGAKSAAADVAESVASTGKKLMNDAGDFAGNTFNSAKNILGFGKKDADSIDAKQEGQTLRVAEQQDRPSIETAELAGEKNNPTAGFNLSNLFERKAIGEAAPVAAPAPTPVVAPVVAPAVQTQQTLG